MRVAIERLAVLRPRGPEAPDHRVEGGSRTAPVLAPGGTGLAGRGVAPEAGGVEAVRLSA